jgi:hypothetical protein
MIRGGGGCVVMITSVVVQGGRRTGRLRTGLRVPDSILDSSFRYATNVDLMPLPRQRNMLNQSSRSTDDAHKK